MTFPFWPVDVERTPLVPDGIVLRPIIPIRIETATKFAEGWGLIDTGADVTLLPRFLADVLEVEVEDEPHPIRGVAGATRMIVSGVVGWVMDQDLDVHRWSSRVGFLASDDPDQQLILIGLRGFLEYFRVTFDPAADVIELTPGPSFPATSTE